MLQYVSKLAEIRADRGAVRAAKHVENVLHYGVNFGFLFLEEEAKGSKKWTVSPSTRAIAWKHGFTSKSWILLNLAEEDPSEYINDVDKLVRLPRTNKPYQGIVSNKASFYSWFDRFDDRLPTIYGSIIRGDFVGDDGDGSADIVERLDQDGRLVLKPVHGHRGRGVLFLEACDGGYRLSGKQRERRFDREANLREALGRLESYLVSEHVEQHAYADQIYPHTSNTIRVLTLVDPDTGEPFVARATHRFGTDDSRPLDTWSQGGVGVPIDVERGELRDVYYHGSAGGVETRHTHPDTGARITGVELPHWDRVRETARRFAGEISGAPYLSWDVLLTPDGPIVIEANSPGDKDLVQLDGGLLAEPRCRSALAEYL